MNESKLAAFKNNVVVPALEKCADHLPAGMHVAFVAYDPNNPEMDIFVHSGYEPMAFAEAIKRRVMGDTTVNV